MFNNKTVSAVIPAAGLGRRMGTGTKKQFLEIYGIPVIIHTLNKIISCGYADEIIVVTGRDDISSMKKLLEEYIPGLAIKVVAGGETRQISVNNGVCASTGEIVLIHDGVRPLVCEKEISDSLEGALNYGAAAAGIPLADTIKLSDEDGFSVKTLPRDNIVRILTPQVLERSLYFKAYENAEQNNLETTDDISLAEVMGIKPKITYGSIRNIKITRPEDIEIATLLMKGEE